MKLFEKPIQIAYRNLEEGAVGFSTYDGMIDDMGLSIHGSPALCFVRTSILYY